MPSNHHILCRPLLLLFSIFPRIRVFSNEAADCIRWPSIGVSALASVLPKNIQGWFPLRLTSLISLLPRDSQVSSLKYNLRKIFSSCIWITIQDPEHNLQVASCLQPLIMPTLYPQQSQGSPSSNHNELLLFWKHTKLTCPNGLVDPILSGMLFSWVS